MARNWYPFYVGDYARKTSHLTLEQHGAYRILLDYYYSTGEPLPLDMKVLYRICRASSRRERDAISTIIEQFFSKTSTGFVSEKCQSEINKALNYSNTQSANAYAKWDAKRMPARASTTTTTTTTTTEGSKEESSAVSHAKESGFSRIYDHGSNLFPKLASRATHEIKKWIDAGCSIDDDIFPTITRHKGKDIGSWSYFSSEIMDAKATRESPLPAGTPKQSTGGKNGKPSTHRDFEQQDYLAGSEGFDVTGGKRNPA